MLQFPSLKNQGALAIDLETFDPGLKKRGPGAHRDGYICGVAVGTEAGFREYYPIAHEGEGNQPKAKVLGWLQEQLKLPVPKIGARLIYDLTFLDAVNVHAAGPFYDIQNAEPLIDENKYSYSLDTIAKKYLKIGKNEDQLIDWITTHLGIKRQHKNYIYKVPGHIVARYAKSDVDLPLRIFKHQKRELERQDLWDLFEMESALIPMLMAMHRRGVRVDADRAEQLRKEFQRKQQRLELKIKRDTGIEIQPWAARNLAKIFDHYKLGYPRTEKTEAPSFTKSFLGNHPHPVAKTIIGIRQYDKLANNFLENIIEKNIKGRIHTTFNQQKSEQGGTVTGRFSSSGEMNLQQIPIRSEDGKRLREIFIPEDEQDWVRYDYSQIEYRLIANDAAHFGFRGGQHVVDIFNDNPLADFHQIIADMTGLSRYNAKTINFGIAYGEGINKLCRDLGLSREEGNKLLRKYHQNAPFMRPMMQYYMDMAQREREVLTLFGRKRRYNKWMLQKGDEEPVFLDHRVPGSELAFTYSALNSRIQGSAADIMKYGMLDIWNSGVCDVLGVPHLTVHDELDFSAPHTKKATEARREVKRILESVVDLKLTLTTEMSIGKNWGQCEVEVENTPPREGRHGKHKKPDRPTLD